MVERKNVRKGEKIYLKLNNMYIRTFCCISGEPFKMETPYAFFLELESDYPVKPEVALKIGYTMSENDFEYMIDMLDTDKLYKEN